MPGTVSAASHALLIVTTNLHADVIVPISQTGKIYRNGVSCLKSLSFKS